MFVLLVLAGHLVVLESIPRRTFHMYWRTKRSRQAKAWYMGIDVGSYSSLRHQQVSRITKLRYDRYDWSFSWLVCAFSHQRTWTAAQHERQRRGRQELGRNVWRLRPTTIWREH